MTMVVGTVHSMKQICSKQPGHAVHLKLEVFCFCFCGYEIIYYYLFESEQCLCLKYELKSSLFLVVIMSKVSEIAAKAKES
jgi:hypothetical protein